MLVESALVADSTTDHRNVWELDRCSGEVDLQFWEFSREGIAACGKFLKIHDCPELVMVQAWIGLPATVVAIRSGCRHITNNIRITR